MPQHHLDRLSSIDASFLAQEGPTSHMHIGGVLIFEGPPPAFDDLLDHVRSRLHLVPRYRQKLATPPLETGRPLWADDPTFNLEYHVRNTALPAPGSEDQLLRLAARIASQQLDRSKPLWEMWVVEGLERDRFGIISKTHHSLVDGVAGVDLATVLFDVEHDPAPPPADLEPWQPSPEPSAAEMVLAGMRGMVKTSIGLAERVFDVLPLLFERGGERGQAVVDVAQAVDAEVLQGLGRLADEGQFAAGGEDDDQVAGALDVGQAVGDAHHRLAGVRQRPEQGHHLAVGLLVQARRHLVQEHQRRLAQQLISVHHAAAPHYPSD